ncbi:MAG TPA: ATP-binding protein [Solirubrobacteraceae bacterium]
MSRLPIRARMTAAFALALVLVLAGACAFVYAQLRADLNETVDATLAERLDIAVLGGRLPVVEDREEGRVLRGESLLTADERRRLRRDGEVRAERRVSGVEGRARLRAANDVNGVPVVAVQSLDDRDEALDTVLTSFAVGGAAALLLASLIGYALATAGLRPVEAMRRRASEVSLDRAERLPLPAAHDEVRRLGETLNAMLARLQRSFARERRFVADASHELRTPIAVVKTELEAALNAQDCGPQTRESLSAAIAECDRLAQLADDLLVLAQAGEGRLPVRREHVDPRALLEGVRAQFQDRAARQQRPLRVDADETPLDGDPLRLRQALGNLVDNALRHGDGAIVLSAREGALEVRDEGAGFDERAFEHFTRGDPARTRDAGAGLGLAIVRAIAEAHGGTATVAGAAVRLTLPQGRLIGPA